LKPEAATETNKSTLKIGLPKGSLQDATIRMMRHAGWTVNVSDRSTYPSVDDEELEIVLLRAQEIPRYVMDGVLDCGITGHDNVLENSADVHEVCELIYSKATSRPIAGFWPCRKTRPSNRPKICRQAHRDRVGQCDQALS
jgi:hypothetical protein